MKPGSFIDTHPMTDQTPVERPGVTATVGLYGELVDRLSSLITGLEERIGVILYPSPKTELASKPTPTLVPLAEQIKTYNDRLQMCVDRVDDILGRIEL